MRATLPPRGERASHETNFVCQDQRSSSAVDGEIGWKIRCRMTFEDERIIFYRTLYSTKFDRHVHFLFRNMVVIHRQYERWMNKAPWSGIIFLARECAVRCRTFRLRYDAAVQQFPKEKKDEYSQQTVLRLRACRFRPCRRFAGAGADRAGMQRQVPGRQGRRHARWPEVERLPQGSMRRRRPAGPDCGRARARSGCAQGS